MIKSNKGIAYPLLLIPFIFILIAYFTISIINVKNDTNEDYGSISTQLDTLIGSHKTYELWYEQGIEESYYRYFITGLKTEVFNSCQEESYNFIGNNLVLIDEIQLETQGSNLDDAFSCFDDINSDYNFMERYENDLKEFFLAVERPQETIKYNLSVIEDEVEVSVISILELNSSTYSILSNKSYDVVLPLLEIDDFTSSNLTNYNSIIGYKDEVKMCIFNGGEVNSCHNEIAKKYFSIDSANLSVEVVESGDYDNTYFNYEFFPGVEIQFIMNLLI